MDMKKRQAFTLAEVLLSMLVLGIVAVMTIPALLNEVKDRQYWAIFYKSYTVVQEAISYARGNGETFYDTNKKAWESVKVNDDFDLYRKYLKIFDGPRTDCLYFDKNQCFPLPTFRGLNKQFISLNVENAVSYVTPNQAVIAFGEIQNLGAEGNIAPVVFIDANGVKKPNMLGRDIFLAYMDVEKNQLLPMGAMGTPFENQSLCDINKTGYTCAYEIIKNKSYEVK